MSKYKVGDKVILTVTSTNEMGCLPCYVLNDDLILSRQDIDKYSEPLSTYTEPLEAKIRRQAAEITRLLAENKRLKAENGNSLWNIEQARAEGQNEAWELARKLSRMEIDDKIQEAFNLEYSFALTVIEQITYPEAAAKVEAWEKAKEEIKVGDVFQDDDGNNAIVTSIKGNTIYYMWDDGDTRSGFAEDVKKHFTKTGRHIDIDSFLKQIGEE